MAIVPKRQALTGALIYRKVLDFFEKKIRTPKINPSWMQVIAIFLSIYYLFLSSDIVKIFFIIIVLITDWLDGAIARQQKKASFKGWMIDVLVDRLSEGFIFWAEISTSFGFIFFLLWILNIILSIYSVKTKKHILLALRFLFIFVLIFRLL